MIVAKDKRVTARHVRLMQKPASRKSRCPTTSCGPRARKVHLQQETGEKVVDANTKLPRNLRAAREKVRTIETIFTNDLDRGPYMSDTLRLDDARRPFGPIAIYRMMRPGEPPTEDAVEGSLSPVLQS